MLRKALVVLLLIFSTAFASYDFSTSDVTDNNKGWSEPGPDAIDTNPNHTNYVSYYKGANNYPYLAASPDYCKSGKKDCSGGQSINVHDLGETVNTYSKNVDLIVDVVTGWSEGCDGHLFVSVSREGKDCRETYGSAKTECLNSWEPVWDSFQFTETLEIDGERQHHILTIPNFEVEYNHIPNQEEDLEDGKFRYVEVSLSECNVDWSKVIVREHDSVKPTVELSFPEISQQFRNVEDIPVTVTVDDDKANKVYCEYAVDHPDNYGRKMDEKTLEFVDKEYWIKVMDIEEDEPTDIPIRVIDGSRVQNKEDFELPTGEYDFKLRCSDYVHFSETIEKTFKIDRTGPDISISGFLPDNNGWANSENVEVFVNGAVSKFQCKIDDGSWENCDNIQGNRGAPAAPKKGTGMITKNAAKEASVSKGVQVEESEAIPFTKTIMMVIDSFFFSPPLQMTDVEMVQKPVSMRPVAVLGGDTVTVEDTQKDITKETTSGGSSKPRQETSSRSVSVIFEKLSDGEHTLWVRGVDSLGNVGKGKSIDVLVDATPPSLNIIAPIAPTVVHDEVTVQYSGADDNFDHYEVKINGDNWVNKGTATSHTFSGFPHGESPIKVRAFDLAGNYKEKSVTVYADQQAPAVVVDYPLNNGFVYSEVSEIKFTATDDKAQDLSCVYKLDDEVDWIPVSGVTSGVQKVVSRDVTGEGDHSVYVKCSDEFQESLPVALDFEIDSIAPGKPSITSPLNGTAFTSVNSFTVEYTYDEADTNHTEIQCGGQDFVVDDSPGLSACKNVSDGVVPVVVQSVDAAGNVGLSDAIQVLVSKNAPAVKIVSPTGGIVNVNNVPVQVKSSHPFLTGFVYSLDNVVWDEMDGGCASPLPNVACTENVWMSNGAMTLYVKAVESFGKETNPAASVSFTVDGSNDIPPEILSVSYPKPPSIQWYESVDHVTFTANDDVNSSMYCEYKVDSGGWVATSTFVSLSPKYQQDFTAVTSPEGSDHSVKVRCYDIDPGASKNYVSEVETRVFGIDTSNPTVQIDSPDDGSDVKELSFEFSGQDDYSGVVNYKVQVDSAGWNDTFDLEAWTFLGVYPEGDYDLYVKAVDGVGRESNPATISVTLDKTKPNIQFLSPIDQSTVYGMPGTSTWSSSTPGDVDHYKWQIDGGSWLNKGDSTSHQYNVGNGQHTICARAYDEAGNYKELCNDFTVSVASTPTISIASPSSPNSTIHDDVPVYFTASNGGSGTLNMVQYKIDNGAWNDEGTYSSLATVGINKEIVLNNVPEGDHTLYLRVNKTGNTWSTADSVDVNVNSTFTYLTHSTLVTTQQVGGVPFYVHGRVLNANEENVSIWDIKVNISFPNSGIMIYDMSPVTQRVGDIAGYTSQFATWQVVSNVTGTSRSIKTCMLHEPTGFVKCDQKTINFAYGMMGEPEEEDLPENTGIAKVTKKVSEVPSISRNQDVVVF